MEMESCSVERDMVSEKAAFSPHTSNCTDASKVEESSLQQVSNDSDINSKVDTETHTDYNNCLQTTDDDVDMQTETTSNEHLNCKDVNSVASSDVMPSEICIQDHASVADTSSISTCTSVTEQSSQSNDSLLTPPAGDPSIRIKLLARVAVSDAHFKHQQRGDPDLTMEEKIEIAQKILDENKIKFLSKFSQYLETEDLEYFSDSRHIYEIDFYCKQVLKSKSSDYCKNRVKNRRYEAMKKLVCEGEYFSEEEMKFRDPYLYDQMVGQFLTDEEIQAQVDKSDLRLSSILTRHLDLLDENARFARDRDKEEGQMEEEEEESDDESELESDTEKTKVTDPSSGADDNDTRKKIPEKERQELKEEFLTIMQQRFLSGEDKNFDYSKVDNNEQYDDLDVLNLDCEEKYFDDEDSQSVHSLDSMG